MFGFGGQRKMEWEAFDAEALPLMGDVFRVAKYLTHNQTEAEDLTQETFVQALQSFHRYTPGTNCRAWLVTILYHMNSRRRRKLGQLKLIEDVEEQIAQTVAFVPPIPQSLTDEEILKALTRIPDNFRNILLLTDVEDFSYREVAEMLQVPIGTVMSRLHRGRRLMRRQLTDYARKMGLAAEG